MILLCTNTVDNLKKLRLSFVRYLSNNDNDLKLLTLDSKSVFELPDMYSKDLKGKKNYLKFILHFLKTLKKNDPKIVVAFTTETIFFVGIARLLCKFRYVSVFTGLGTIFISSKIQNNIILFFAKLLISKSDLLIVQNRDDALLLEKKWNLSTKKIKVVNGSGIDIKQKINKKKSHSEKNKRFVLIARLIKEKGILDYLAAIELLRKKSDFEDANISFSIFGSIDNNNPSSIAPTYLEAKCKQSRVNLINYDSSRLQLVLETHSHFVLPSYREGTSKALLEACLGNLFPVVSNVPGCNNVVVDQITGLLFQPKDPVDLSRAILQACRLSNKDTQLIADRARLNVIENFSESKVNEEMLTLITE